jgi:hypothetical protein
MQMYNIMNPTYASSVYSKYIYNCRKYRFGLESREYGRRVPSRWPRGTLYP